MESRNPYAVDTRLDSVSYKDDQFYVPSRFALDFVNFMKLVNADGVPESHPTPVLHYRMLDSFTKKGGKDVANLCARGYAKTTLIEYLFLHIAVYNHLHNFGPVTYGIYISDSIENGVKKMRKRLERRWKNSTFLQKYIPETRFTDTRWYFKNADGDETVYQGCGSQTGIRGGVELGVRPRLAVGDDLLKDTDAKSATVIKSIEDTMYSALEFALDPVKSKIVWNGTPFNARDPLYKAIESGAWDANVYPMCESFPCTRKEYSGGWPERFSYDYAVKKYEKAKLTGKIASFNQELMLRIMSEADKLVHDSDINWYSRRDLLKHIGSFNIYHTTDFAVSDGEANDFSPQAVWAYSSNGDWFLLDAYCEKSLMDKNLDELFRLVQKWKPLGVGIEISGQQKGFIALIKRMMTERNIYFSISKDIGSTQEGIRPKKDKLSRFKEFLPIIKAGKLNIPDEMKKHPYVIELLDELDKVTNEGFKSKHDDCCDTLSQLNYIQPWKPGATGPKMKENPNKQSNVRDIWWDDDDDDEDASSLSSYII